MLRRRIPQLILTVVAGYELRSLVATLIHAVSSLTAVPSGGAEPLWLLGLIPLVIGFVLLQVGRGLGSVARVPRWVLRFLGVWLMASSALFMLSSGFAGDGGHGLLARALASDGLWPGMFAALGGGLVVSASSITATWLARRPLPIPVVAICAPFRRRDRRRAHLLHVRAPLAPVLVGWSDRGPPRVGSPRI